MFGESIGEFQLTDNGNASLLGLYNDRSGRLDAWRGDDAVTIEYARAVSTEFVRYAGLNKGAFRIGVSSSGFHFGDENIMS